MEFEKLFELLPQYKKDVLVGKLELYIGSAQERARYNIDYARKIIERTN